VPYQKPPNFAEMGYSINKEVTLDIAPDEAQDMARNQQVCPAGLLNPPPRPAGVRWDCKFF